MFSNPVILTVIAAYLLIINIVGFAGMGIDKRKAEKRQWRTPETTLFLIAAIGGSIGSIAGMKYFRHKTKHWYFWVINILGLLWQIALPILGLFFLK